MLLDIDSIIYYGRYYSCLEYKYENYWWFGLIDYKVYNVDELIDTMKFKTYADICDSVYYIPLFKTDIISAEKAFMINYNSKKLAQIENECSDYDVAFNIFVETEHIDGRWKEYEKSVLYRDAVLWCKENNIVYKI